jgi:hypothetical protein
MMSIRQFVKQAAEIAGQQKLQMSMKLARGSITGMDQYNREVGRMEGLDLAVGLLKDMLGQVEDAQRDDDLPEMPPQVPQTGTDS